MLRVPNRSNFLILFNLLLFALVNAAHADETNVKKPNIVLILADDVGTGDIPRYWDSSVVDMPNLDRLSDMGVTFKDAHSTPLCAPSRYMLLSGNYAHRGKNPNGSWNFANNRNQFMDTQKSIAEVLRDDGYHTSMFGKWHLGAKAPPNGVVKFENMATLLTNPALDWSLPLIQGPEDIGFETSYITAEGIQGPPYSFFRDGYLNTNVTNSSSIKYWDKGSYSMTHGMSKIGKHPGDGDDDWDSSAFNMIVVNETSKFIDKHMEETPSQPFFTYVALGAVHIPHSPPYHYLDGSRVRKEYPTRHLDMLLEVDKVVGSLVAMIDDRQLADDTIIIFASDNGGLQTKSQRTGHRMSGPLKGEKGSIYEGGHRVPLIMRYDNHFPANKTNEEMVGLNDIYATICELVGVGVPELSAQDSISFADYLDINNEGASGGRTQISTWALKQNRVTNEAIRFGSMKLIRNAIDSTYELYDLATDISEMNDLSGYEVYADMINHMKTKLKADGPCPDDNEGQQSIKGLNQPKGCGWFRKNVNRCKRHLEGELNCYSVCGRNHKFCK